MQDVFDAIVVGGGPGGAACASFLGKKGRKVLLLEKAHFPRDKTCGDGISGKSMRVLKELGVTDAVEAAPHAKIHGVVFSSPDGTVVEIPIPKGNSEKIEYGYCSRREVFDNVLFQNAKRFAQVIEGFSVTDVVWEGVKVVGVKGMREDKVEKEFRAKIVVGADGANSVIAKKVGMMVADKAHLCAAIRAYYKNVRGLTPNIELHFVDEVIPGYFWIFPLENGLANVGVGMVLKDLEKSRVNLKDAMLKAMAENPLFKERFARAELAAPIKGWNLPCGSKRWRPYGNGWLLIGDAATLIDPFTGEGIGNALVSGKFAAQVIDEALDASDFSETFLKRYEEMIAGELDPELQTSYKMQKVGSHKMLLNFFMHKASRSPELRDAIAGTLIDADARTKYLSPLFYLKALLS